MIRDTTNFKKCRATKCQKNGEYINGLCPTCAKQIHKALNKEKKFKRKTYSISKKSDREYSTSFREAKKYFQLWSRLKFADEFGMVKCVHGSIKHYTEIDGGHYIPAEKLSTCFDEINVNPQEKNKNMDMQNPITNQQYTAYMIKKYGNDAVHNLVNRSHMQIKYSSFELKEIAKKYKLMCENKIKYLRL
jgi:hypothetical protein